MRLVCLALLLTSCALPPTTPPPGAPTAFEVARSAADMCHTAAVEAVMLTQSDDERRILVRISDAVDDARYLLDQGERVCDVLPILDAATEATDCAMCAVAISAARVQAGCK